MPQPNSLPGNYISRSVLPGGQIRIDETQSCVLVPANGCSSDPIIDLVRTGDRIEAIEITCACGKRIRLNCQYEN